MGTVTLRYWEGEYSITRGPNFRPTGASFNGGIVEKNLGDFNIGGYRGDILFIVAGLNYSPTNVSENSLDNPYYPYLAYRPLSTNVISSNSAEDFIERLQGYFEHTKRIINKFKLLKLIYGTESPNLAFIMQTGTSHVKIEDIELIAYKGKGETGKIPAYVSDAFYPFDILSKDYPVFLKREGDLNYKWINAYTEKREFFMQSQDFQTPVKIADIFIRKPGRISHFSLNKLVLSGGGSEGLEVDISFGKYANLDGFGAFRKGFKERGNLVIDREEIMLGNRVPSRNNNFGNFDIINEGMNPQDLDNFVKRVDRVPAGGIIQQGSRNIVIRG